MHAALMLVAMEFPSLLSFSALGCLNKTVKAFESVDEIIKGHQTRGLFRS